MTRSGAHDRRAPEGALKNPGLDAKQLLDLHSYMRLTRGVEERLAAAHRSGEMAGSLRRSLGQEAVSVGSAYALEPGDLLGPLMRELGAVLVRGYTPRECFLQHLAREAGPTHGRDGGLHFGEVGGRGVISGISAAGDLISVLAGCGLGLRMQRADRVCLTYIGDGGTSTGGFHEGLNFAVVKKLPLVLIVVNNGYAYSTPVPGQTRQPNFAARGSAYGCPGESVDGNDVLAVYAAARRGVLRARAGEGPSVIEAKTFRRSGHTTDDEASYVPREILAEWEANDPIERYEQWLVAQEVATQGELDAITTGMEAQLDEDLQWAVACPVPRAEWALGGVYEGEARTRPPAHRGP